MDKEQHVRETYARYGVAMYFAQVLEYGLVNTMLMASVVKDSTLRGARVDEFMDREFGRTLGQLIKELRRHVVVSDELSEELAAALKARNWLAHGYFRDRAEEFMSGDGREKMIDELSRIRTQLHEVDQKLEGLALEYGNKVGVTRESVAAELERMKRELKSDI